MCRGVLPSLSTQSISPPGVEETPGRLEARKDSQQLRTLQPGQPPKSIYIYIYIYIFFFVIIRLVLYLMYNLNCIFNSFFILLNKDKSPFWMRVWERVKRPCTAVMCRGLFPSRLCHRKQKRERSDLKGWHWCVTHMDDVDTKQPQHDSKGRNSWPKFRRS